MFETPSSQQAEDLKAKLVKSGLFSENSFEEISKIAETYDKLRQARRMMINNMEMSSQLSHNDDREMADYFQSVLSKAIENTRQQQSDFNEIQIYKMLLDCV